VIHPDDGKIDRHNRWHRRKPSCDGCSGHADRAEIIGMTVARMALAPVGVGRESRKLRAGMTPRAVTVQRVNVTEGQSEIDGQRNERHP